MDSLRLLLVEDDTDSAESLKLLLEYDGHHVQWVRSGAETLMAIRALEQLGEPIPHVALLDLMLPDVSGAALAAELRSSHPDIAVILLSAAPEQVLQRAASACGAFGVLRKPTEWAKLSETIVSAAESVSARRLA